MAENNVILNEEITELVAELKQAQAEVEELSPKTLFAKLLRKIIFYKVSKESIQVFRRFEKLLRKTSEVEDFSNLLTKQEKEYLRLILKDGTKVYSDFLEYARIRPS